MININYFAKKMNGAQNDGGIPIVNREEDPSGAQRIRDGGGLIGRHIPRSYAPKAFGLHERGCEEDIILAGGRLWEQEICRPRSTGH